MALVLLTVNYTRICTIRGQPSLSQYVLPCTNLVWTVV